MLWSRSKPEPEPTPEPEEPDRMGDAIADAVKWLLNEHRVRHPGDRERSEAEGFLSRLNRG